MGLAEQIDISQNMLVLFDDDDRLILQSHWRRFGVSIVASVLSCAVMLAGFAEILISERPIAPPRTTAVEAFLVEPPRPAEPAKPIPIAPILHPAPRKNLASIKPRNAIAPAPAPPLNPAPAALPASSVGGIDTGRATVPSESEPSGAGGGSLEGGASESIGARALYAPTPQIPDDLRENIFSALAIAHFVVDREGQVQVTLVQPTSSPRLNQVILASLQTWKFFPATRDGIPVASEFDLRIPIAVE
jgi:protein TonB